MGDLTANISRSELQCSCGCGSDSMDFETIQVVQHCCDHFAHKQKVDKVVLRITSAHRCFKYNRLPETDGGPGSNDNSQHPQARAIDFKIGGVSPADVYAFLVERYPDKYGFGRYNSFTHADTKSGGPRRW